MDAASSVNSAAYARVTAALQVWRQGSACDCPSERQSVRAKVRGRTKSYRRAFARAPLPGHATHHIARAALTSLQRASPLGNLASRARALSARMRAAAASSPARAVHCPS